MQMILSILCIALFIGLLMFLVCYGICYTPPEERTIEDIEQMKFLTEYSNNRKRRKRI